MNQSLEMNQKYVWQGKPVDEEFYKYINSKKILFEHDNSNVGKPYNPEQSFPTNSPIPIRVFVPQTILPAQPDYALHKPHSRSGRQF